MLTATKSSYPKECVCVVSLLVLLFFPLPPHRGDANGMYFYFISYQRSTWASSLSAIDNRHKDNGQTHKQQLRVGSAQGFPKTARACVH